MSDPLKFEILHRATDCPGRLGRVRTTHGAFDTPTFMPVGSAGAIKGLLPHDVAAAGAQVILANTYHLMLRPGAQLIADMGGLHGWMRWSGSVVTDSGGFQVFSLAHTSRINDDGVVFNSHLDGASVELTPERSIQMQNKLGADIIMALDDCPPTMPPSGRPKGQNRNPTVHAGSRHTTDGSSFETYPNARRVAQACERSVRWLERCIGAHRRGQDQALFAIVQGGTDLERRTWCVQRMLQHDLPGFAIGGVAVGEGFEGLKAVVEHTAALLPQEKPRYLMGVGYEKDILTAVRAGVDMFDCVLPTRNGRNANAFTPSGQIHLRNARYARDPAPLDPNCDCAACSGCPDRPNLEQPALAKSSGPFSRSYLRHLFLAGEMLGPILVSLHNIRHFQRYLLDIRRAIAQNDWSAVARKWPVSELSRA